MSILLEQSCSVSSALSRLPRVGETPKQSLEIQPKLKYRFLSKARHSPYILTLVEKIVKPAINLEFSDVARMDLQNIYDYSVNFSNFTMKSALTALQTFEYEFIEPFDGIEFIEENKHVTKIVPKTRFYPHIFAYLTLEALPLFNITIKTHVPPKPAKKPKKKSAKKKQKRVKKPQQYQLPEFLAGTFDELLSGVCTSIIVSRTETIEYMSHKKRHSAKKATPVKKRVRIVVPPT